MLLDCYSLLWDLYALLWEIKMKSLIIWYTIVWNDMLWYAMLCPALLCYAMLFGQKHLHTQKSFKHLEVKWLEAKVYFSSAMWTFILLNKSD